MSSRSLQDPADQMEHWGYYLLPAEHPHFPGYTGLVVAIRATPTREHYDPESISLQLFNSARVPERATLHLTSPIHRPRGVAPGPIVLCDRKNKEETFFSFGATVESNSMPGEIIYAIRSTAPILWLTRGGDTDADQLAAEFGRLIAEVRAEVGERDELFFARLGNIDPLVLYTATLYSIVLDYERVSSLRASYPEFSALLYGEKKWLETTGQWPASPVTLARLLYPQNIPDARK